MRSFERRQELLSILNARRFEKICNLAQELEVSRRTIERDIFAISLKYPVYTTQGNGGGVHMLDGCYLDKKYLTVEQVRCLNRAIEKESGIEREVLLSILSKFSMPKERG